MNKLLISALILMAGCQQRENTTTAVDSSAAVKKTDTAKTVGDNLVKSEAPDANDSIEQGYSMSRHNNGVAQSPIDILSTDVQQESGKPMEIHFHTYIVATENLGHTVQVDFRDGSTCVAGGKTYNSKQFHFHTPSEHMIDGMTYPLEMHIVNQLRDSDANAKPSFLVIAVLFKMGKENKLINEFLKQVPHEEGEKDPLASDSVNLNDVAPQLLREDGKDPYYTYDGSLTTPPFTERVHWVVLKRIVEASPEQINAIAQLEGNNARHIQALYNRKVSSSNYQ